MQLKQILKVTLNLIQLRTLGDIVTTTDFRFNRDIATTTVCCLNRDINYHCLTKLCVSSYLFTYRTLYLSLDFDLGFS